MNTDQLIAWLRDAAAHPHPAPQTLAVWRTNFRVQDDTFVTAIFAGIHADQLAFCFAGGYQAALRRLLPSLPATAFAALLLSEGKRQRPEDLTTALTPLESGGWRLDGEKSWVAGGAAADSLLVIARHGVASDGRVQAVLVVLPSTLAGVVHSAGRETGLLNAIPHGRVRFEGVIVEAGMLAPGDGWRDYARPFRTIEDIHVTAAIAAYLAVAALRASLPPSLVAALIACIVRFADCAARAPTDAVTHLLLAGAEREMQQIAVEINQLIVGHDDPFAHDWRVNHLLMMLASTARAARLQKAMAVFRQQGADRRGHGPLLQ